MMTTVTFRVYIWVSFWNADKWGSTILKPALNVVRLLQINVDDKRGKKLWMNFYTTVYRADIKSHTQLVFTTSLLLNNKEQSCVHMNANYVHRADGACSPEIVLCKLMLKSFKCMPRTIFIIFHSIKDSSPWYSLCYLSYWRGM